MYPKSGNRRILDRYGDMPDSLSYQVDGGRVLVGIGQAYGEFSASSL